MKRALILLLAVVMIPVFAGLFCPCAQAAQPETVNFQRLPCQGCCPDMKMASGCQAELSQKVAILFERIQVPNVLKALCLDASQGIAINRRAYVPAGDEPLWFSPQPLYLSLQVLRI